MLTLKGEFIEQIQQTKKGGFIRKFLVTFAGGSRKVVSVWSATSAPLEKNGVCELSVDIGEMVFAK
jgi:hypothetical protein